MTLEEIKDELNKLGIEFNEDADESILAVMLNEAKQQLFADADKSETIPSKRAGRKYKKPQPPLDYVPLVKCNEVAAKAVQDLAEERLNAEVAKAKELLETVEKMRGGE